MTAAHAALDCATLSHPGMVRSHNEDTVFVDADAGIAILADGMGGYNAGEVASGIAVNVVSNGMLPDLRSGRELSKIDIASGLTHAALLLQQQIAAANKGIYEAAQARPECAGMGTTIVSAVFCGNRVSIGHIGDSRCYRLRGEKFEQLTHDHSLLQEQIDSGQLTQEQAKYSLNKNLVTRALGIEAIVPADIVEYRVEANDVYAAQLRRPDRHGRARRDPEDRHREARRSRGRGRRAGRHREPERRARQHLGGAGPRAARVPAFVGLGAALSREEEGVGEIGGPVAKLVLYLADGTTLDVRLTRERITIGRRADNDVCLPYPAVSGEHAAVVTILADSFLEDLGSTNGTLVNGKTIAKHFLRDRDQIDIGRQKLVYVVDDSVQLEPAAPPLAGVRNRVFGERVESANMAPPRIAVPDAEPAPAAETTSARGGSMADIERFVAAEVGAKSSPEEVRLPAGAAQPRATEPEPGPREPQARVRVLTGPSAGREVALDKDETVVGRIGVQVAAVKRVDGTFRLVPLEGSAPPSVSGTAIAAEGQVLRLGDAFEVAGVTLELVEPAATARH